MLYSTIIKNILLPGLVTPDGSSDIDYDATGQVTSASLTDEEYEYDAVGNRTSGGSVVGGDNRLLEDATYVYTYDLEGNLIGKARKDGAESTTYEWDYRNRLIAVTVKNISGQVTLAAVYSYDAFDRRIGRTVNGTINVSERYVYDSASNAQAVVVLDGNGTPLTRILYGIVENQVLVEEELPTGHIRWTLCDHLQSVRDVLNNSGTVINHITYDSFGNILSQSNTINTPRNLYTGAPLDAETGWTYLHRRYYDASLGRFMSQDPIAFAAGDTNLYRYVGNNPLTNRDPSGLCAEANDSILQRLIGTAAIAYDPTFLTSIRIQALCDLMRELQELDMLTGDVKDQLDLLAKQLSQLTNAANAAVHYANPASSSERMRASGEILYNALSLGLTDKFGVTHSYLYQDTGFTLSRISASVASGGLLLLTGGQSGYLQTGTAALLAFAGGANLGFAAVDVSNGNYKSAVVNGGEGVLLLIGANAVRSAAGAANVVEQQPLNWSRVNPAGETGQQHVLLHGANNTSKPLHGVFTGDPVRTTQEAWVRSQGIQPTVQGAHDMYIVPMGRTVGTQGGNQGTGASLTNVKIVVERNTNQVVTAYPI